MHFTIYSLFSKHHIMWFHDFLVRWWISFYHIDYEVWIKVFILSLSLALLKCGLYIFSRSIHLPRDQFNHPHYFYVLLKRKCIFEEFNIDGFYDGVQSRSFQIQKSICFACHWITTKCTIISSWTYLGGVLIR